MFVTKGTPQEVIDVLAAITEETMASDAAQQLMIETGAGVYWQDAATAAERVLNDREVVGGMMEAIGQ